MQTSAGAKGSDLDSADDVRSELVAGEVVDEAACAGVVGADDGAEQRFNLVKAALEGEDVALGGPTLVAGAGISARYEGLVSVGEDRTCCEVLTDTHGGACAADVVYL